MSVTPSKTEQEKNIAYWREQFDHIPFESKNNTWQPRYYQEVAIQKVLEAIAQKEQRVLLTLATGTGKTAIAFQIVWKLFHSKWNLQDMANQQRHDSPAKRPPRVLFLADRNILANQAFNAFSAFEEEALIRILPD